MTPRLNRFRVTDFRSIVDSDWITTEDVTALIGINESGKTNVLTALWKLKPAKGGAIHLIDDLPRKRYHTLRKATPMPTFVAAEFTLDDATVSKICATAECTPEEVRIVRASRSFDDNYTVAFPNERTTRTVSTEALLQVLDELAHNLDAANELRGERGLKTDVSTAVVAIRESLSASKEIDQSPLATVLSQLETLRPGKPMKTSAVVRGLDRAIVACRAIADTLARTPPSHNQEARNLAWDSIPPFVYYSQYGNLDSEIYLPHVIDNLQRDDLGVKDEARARTLKVLFEFVQLSPQEILQLGQEATSSGEPTAQQLEDSAERKKEREILLQSASTDLTARFREWWKQGDYRFRFQADGNHFRIWVSDDRRPEPIELEGRSSGLQWFFSFYLVFLVEAEDSHEDAILLLDEPGLSLHPVSQRDLSAFFRGLSTKNQLLYTTHSPFMVDTDRLDRVVAVFTTESGATAMSADLYAPTRQRKEDREKSIYPVHAALGITVSDALLQGCQIVVVEGFSDQLYLSAVKTLLIGGGHLKPARELVFVPAKGVKGVKAVAAILSSKENTLPQVFVDGDAAGREFAAHLKKDLYAGVEDRVRMVGDFYDDVPDPETEDLWPTDLWAREASRLLRGPEPEFDEDVDQKKAVCGQVEEYAKKHNLDLQTPGWKTTVAQRIKRIVLDEPGKLDFENCKKGKAWRELFARLAGAR